MNITQLKAEERHVAKLINLIATHEEYTHSDVHGVLTAIVKDIARDKDLLTFEERLTNSRDNDLNMTNREKKSLVLRL